MEIIKRDYIQSTGLNSDDLALAGAVFDTDMETVVCPGCSTRFEPTSRKCPDCGLQFG